jgi:hypothetical protein
MKTFFGEFHSVPFISRLLSGSIDATAWHDNHLVQRPELFVKEPL